MNPNSWNFSEKQLVVTDYISQEHRSWNMGRITSENSTPERIVRSVLHRMGYRFRLHVKNLPGRPDITLKKHNLVIFVHGCFWHRHQGCKRCTIPKSNQEFWLNKFERNVRRDRENQRKLIQMGWRVEAIWECQTKNWDEFFSILGEILPSMFDMRKSLEKLEDEEIKGLIEIMK